MLVPKRDLKDLEESRFKEQILSLYSQFKQRVSESRSLETEKVESIAEGRIHSGLDAFEFGLVDSIGGLEDALIKARELAKIPENKKVGYDEFPKPKFKDKILKQLTSAGSNESAASFIADLLLPEHILSELQLRIEHNGQAMPILPFDFELRRRGIVNPV
jgi:ClpP class serine protease